MRSGRKIGVNNFCLTGGVAGRRQPVQENTARWRNTVSGFSRHGKLAEKTIENALKYGITIHDSSYLSLAELENKTFYTADEKLLTKLKDNPHTRHISKYKQNL